MATPIIPTAPAATSRERPEPPCTVTSAGRRSFRVWSTSLGLDVQAVFTVAVACRFGAEQVLPEPGRVAVAVGNDLCRADFDGGAGGAAAGVGLDQVTAGNRRVVAVVGARNQDCGGGHQVGSLVPEGRNGGQRNDGDSANQQGILNQALPFTVTKQFAKHEITPHRENRDNVNRNDTDSEATSN